MKKTLVSIVSDQTLPNIEFIREMGGDIDNYLFISTKKMEEGGQRNWILNTTNIPDSKVLDPIVVEEFSFDDIEKKLEGRIDEENFFVVNITGGTKVMSLAVYDFFKAINSEIYYLPGNKQKIKIHPGRKKTPTSLTATINLDDYLSAYGYRIQNIGKPLRSYDYLESLLDYFLNKFNPEQDNQALEVLRRKRTNGLKNLHQDDFLPSFLEKIYFDTELPNQLSKYECKFLSGEWLEEYLFLLIKNNLGVQDDHIGLGYNISLMENPPNEFDVLVMKDNKLYLFECKTSIYNEEGKTFMTETIYKADALRKRFGLFTQTAIVTLSDIEDQRLKDHVQRAQSNNVRLIGKKSFLSGSLITELSL